MKEKTLLQTFYRLSVDMDEEGLREHSFANWDNRGYCDTVVQYLAKQGNTDAVWFLINAFNADCDLAARSYAHTGNKEQVEELMQYRGVTVRKAAQYYAEAGMIELASDLVNREQICTVYGAINGYHLGGQFASVDKILKILSCLNTSGDRESLSHSAHFYNHLYDEVDYLHRAAKINRTMRVYDLNYRQAKTLFEKPGLRKWLLQIKRSNTIIKILPHNEFLDVTARAYELSYRDMRKIYRAVCKNTYKGATERIITRHNNTLFAKRYGMNGQVRPARHKRDREELDKGYKSDKRRVRR